jgi:hypothetical protein|tara:strand:- start:168 stop:1022 length:855 start_codon:yes stop_codon:yes gene_type:complete
MKELTFFTTILILFSSCETVVPIELAEGNKNIVVESYLEFPDTLDYGFARVKLTESSAFNSSVASNTVSNATIFINDTYALQEDPDSLGYYTSTEPIPYTGEQEFSIEIVADLDNKEGRWKATNAHTNIPSIDSIYYTYEPASPPFSEEGYFVKIMLTDPAAEQNFYHLTVLINDTSRFELNPGTKRSLIIQDRYVNGMDLDFEVNDVPLYPGDTLEVVLSSITEEVYFYYFNLYTLLTETSGVGAAPPFPLSSNLVSLNDNLPNALGFFQVRSTTQRQIVIEK